MTADTASPSPLSVLKSDIQLAGFHYIACLKYTASSRDGDIRIGDRQFRFDNITREDTRLLRGEYQRWAATSVIRDVLESFSIFLMSTYAEIVGRHSDLNFPIQVGQFEKRGIEDQASVLSSIFQIDDRWTKRLAGYTRARNSLAHRNGIVGDRDLTDADCLVVSWISPAIRVLETSNSDMATITGDMQSLIQAKKIFGKDVIADFPEREMRFRKGEQIRFAPDNVLDIIGTIQFSAVSISTLADAKPNCPPKGG